MDRQGTVTCPLCDQRVPVKDHPSPAWRSMLPHDHDGEQCLGTGRCLAEAQEFARVASCSEEDQ